MKRTAILPVLALSTALAAPAFAISGIPEVPSLWPAEGAFNSEGVAPVIATKNVTEPTDTAPQESADR